MTASHLSTASRTTWVRVLADAHLGPSDHVLLVGDASEVRRAAELTGALVTVADAAQALQQPPCSVSLALVSGTLETQEWDRWWLQGLHGVLRPGGRLVLEVRHLLDLSSVDGVADLGARALRQGLRRVGIRSTGAFSPRRYTRARLQPMLERLRFRVDAITAAGRAPWASWGPGADGFASRLLVISTALPELPGPPPSDWPPAERERAYDRAHFERIREPWVAAHGARFLTPPEEFDPAAYSDANILVLAPHPDDEVIGAGGTLLRLAAAGARIHAIQATDGSAGAALERHSEAERVRVRVDEARAVAHAAGFAAITCWLEDNRAFVASDARVLELRAILQREQPRIIFVPFVTETHPDHLTLGRMLAAAIGDGRELPPATQVWCYEVWSLVPPNRRSDVTAEMPRVAGLLRLYEMAMRIDDFVHFCADRALDHYRTWHGRDGYAEAFLAVPAARFAELLATVEAPR